MGKLKDMFENIEIERLQDDWAAKEQEGLSKIAVTVRLDGIVIAGLDKMAEHHNQSRQRLLATIVETGLQEVIEGTFLPYENAADLVADFRKECLKAAKEAGYL